MSDLLRALDRGVRSRWWAAAALVPVGIAVAVAVSPQEKLEEPAVEPAACVEARGIVDDARRAGSSSRAASETLTDRIQQYLGTSRAIVDETCDGIGALDSRAIDVLACVRRNALLLRALESLHDDGTLTTARTLDTVRRLPEPRACDDPGRLVGQPSRPADAELAAAEQDLRDDVEHARMLRIAGLHDRAHASLDVTILAAEALPSRVAQAEAQLELSRLVGIEGDADAAVVALRAAIVAAERAGHERCKASAQLELGSALSNTGAFDVAQAELDRAEATIERIGSPAELRWELARSRGFVALRAGEFSDAVDHLRRAIAVRESERGRSDFALVGPVNLLGAALAQSRRFEEAIAAFERAEGLVAEHYGADHPLMGRVLNNLAEAHFGRGDTSRARKHFERALAAHERTVGAEHPSTLMARTNLAELELSLGHVEAGREYAERALADAERVHPADSPELRFTLMAAAWSSALAGDHDTALSRLERAERIVANAWGEESGEYLEIASTVLEVLELCGEDDAFASRKAMLERMLREHEITPGVALAAALERSPG